jgi:hypothetical protein
MPVRRATLALACGILALTAMSAASQPPSPSAQPPNPPSQPPVLEARPDSIVNRVWVVVASPSVAAGTLYAFLGDGSLVVASTTGTPSVGRWTLERGRLTLVEDGREYPVEMHELTATRFRIRVRNPGTPTEITLAPAPSGTARPGDPGPGSITPMPTTYRCGDTTFKVAFESGMAYVTMPDGTMERLPFLGPDDSDGPIRGYTNRRLTFVVDRSGPTPQVRFARGRMAPVPCEPVP